ncbi:hypothetical protein FGB62_169g10 [Gracilaria domingensis]|nr:hypothetical protein FGB62_169g10 [Gracilaria domingensis]
MDAVEERKSNGPHKDQMKQQVDFDQEGESVSFADHEHSGEHLTIRKDADGQEWLTHIPDQPSISGIDGEGYASFDENDKKPQESNFNLHLSRDRIASKRFEPGKALAGAGIQGMEEGDR